MERLVKGILLLLVVSIIINLTLFSKVGSLKDQVANTNQQVQQMNNQYNGINSQLSRTHQQLEQLKESQAWVTHQEFLPVVDKSSRERIVLSLKWSFREIESNADILLLYRAEAGEWIRQQGERVEGTNYQAELELNPELAYEYQILTEGAVMKSGEIAKVPEQLYQPVQLYTSEVGTSSSGGELTRFDATVRYTAEPLFDFYRMSQAKVLFYQDEQLLFEKKLSPAFEDEGRNIPLEKNNWKVVVNHFDTTPTAVYLEIEYANGMKEKELMWTDEGIGKGNHNSSMQGESHPPQKVE